MKPEPASAQEAEASVSRAIEPNQPAQATPSLDPSSEQGAARPAEGSDSLGDEELMNAYVQGEQDCFAQLFDRYAPLLTRMLHPGVRSTADVHDLVQQTFLQLHRHRNDYDGTRPFRPWLLTIALNLRRQYFRRAKARPEAELSAAVEQSLSDPARPHGTLEQRQRVLYAMEELSEDQREVIVLHWMEGVPMPEIAKLLGISLSAVKVRAHRGYAAMRARLRQER